MQLPTLKLRVHGLRHGLSRICLARTTALPTPRSRSRLARQIMVRWLRIPFGHQLITAALPDRLRHHGFGIVNVAEQSRGGRACEHAGRLSISLGEVFDMDPINEKGALSHLLELL